jgi:hypothetical protein
LSDILTLTPKGKIIMYKESVDTTLTAVGRLTDLMRSATSESLIEYTQDTRVEPIVILDQSLRNQPYITDALHSLVSIFSGYYLQAVSISSSVGNIDVARLLDKLSTERSPSKSAGGTFAHFLSMESYDVGLPTVSSEARRDKRSKKDDFESGSKTDSGAHAKLADASNLSVGKLLKVTIKENGHEAEVDVSVRLRVKATGQDAITKLMAGQAKDTSARMRFIQWDVKELALWRDIVLCSDLIESNKKAMIQDKDGTIATLASRRTKNRIAGIFSGEPSVNNASAMVVISDQTRRQIEKDMGGKFKRFKDRQRMFENTLTMIIMVIDTEWEQLTIYHRGIEEPTQLAVKELKSLNKGTGPDVGEILKAYQLGNSPQF